MLGWPGCAWAKNALMGAGTIQGMAVKVAYTYTVLYMELQMAD